MLAALALLGCVAYWTTRTRLVSENAVQSGVANSAHGPSVVTAPLGSSREPSVPNEPRPPDARRTSAAVTTPDVVKPTHDSEPKTVRAQGGIEFVSRHFTHVSLKPLREATRPETANSDT